MNRTTSIFTALIIGLCLTALLSACTSGSPKHTQQSLTPDVQVQLDALETPQGVDPQVFAQLKDAFAKAMQERGKIASTPPTGAANEPANVHFVDEGGGSYTLHWEYRNTGDYDQNGTVGVTDITPLAIHFNHDPGTDGMDIVLHPSGAGKVGISDVTAIAMNFGTNVTGYWLSQATAESGPWADLGGKPLSELEMTDTGGWRDYRNVITPVSGDWYLVTPFDVDGNRGEPSTAVQFGGGGTAPTITDVQPQTGETGTVLTPNVAYTGDPATTVAWDFGGGATPNTSSGLSPSVTLGAPGLYPSSITLTNGAGSDTFGFTLVVTAGPAVWQYYKVVDFANTGNYISFAMIFGKPAFAYVNGAFGTIHYVRSNVEIPDDPSAWVDMLADESSTRLYDGNISLVEDQYETPAIIGWNSGDGKAYFLGSDVTEPANAADWAISEIGLADEAGSLALANGAMYATLKYIDGLHFYQATTYPPTGTQDWTDALVDGTMGTGGNSKLIWNEEDDNFYIFYYNYTAQSLNTAHCPFADVMTPTSWVTYRASSTSGNLAGEYFDFAFDPTPLSMNLYYCYTSVAGGMKRLNGVLGEENADNPNSFSFGMIATDDLANNGEMCSLAFGGGHVMTAYRGNDVTQLIYNASPYTTNHVPLGWAPEVVPEVSLSPVTDTNMLVLNNTNVMIVYGREDGIYFATLPLT
jgi:hypothetical protein